MTTSEQVKIDVVQINLEITALDRLVQYYFNKIEQVEQHLSPDSDLLAFLNERYYHVNDEVAARLKLKQDAGLTI